MDARGQQLAETFVKMLNTHDPDLVDQFVAEDYVNHNAFVDDGREANRQFWHAFFAALPDLSASMEDLVISGDRVVGRFVYRGTHKGAFMGIPASGSAVEMRSIDIWRIEDGMFVEHWDELNTLEVFQQMGALPSLGGGGVSPPGGPAGSLPAHQRAGSRAAGYPPNGRSARGLRNDVRAVAFILQARFLLAAYSAGMSAFTDAEIEFVNSQRLGRLATVGADAMPHVMPVAVFYDPDADALVIGANAEFGEAVMTSSKKFRDAQRRPQAAVVLDDPGPRILEVRGQAETHLDGGEEAGRRLGAPFRFAPAWIRIRPRRIVAVGITGGPFESSARNVP